MNIDTDLREIEQRMAMARPWDTAEPESLWSITGEFPGVPRHTFRDCVAITLAVEVTDTDRPVFMFVGALGRFDKLVDPEWITRATPLLIVRRDEPGTAHRERDQHWIEMPR